MITEDFEFAVVRWSRPEIHWLRRGSHPSAEAHPHAASSLVTFELITVGDPASVRHESSRVRVNVCRTSYCVSLLVRLLFLSFCRVGCIINRALETAGAISCRRGHRAAGQC